MPPTSEDDDDAAKRPIKAVIFGIGTVATSAVALSSQRPWLRVVGAIRAPENRAQPAEATGWEGVELWSDPDTMLDDTQPDVALIATRSPLEAVLPDIERCARHGVHVICTSEELAWPDVERPGESARLGQLAASAGISIVATGINPGFVFDSLPLMLAGAAWDVRRIHVVRVLDASVFGRRVHRSLGIGYTVDAFDDAVASRHIRGHIGFAESAHAIADAMGVELEHFDEHLEPVLAERLHELREYTIRPAETAGVTQRAVGTVAGGEWLRFDLSLHVAPSAIGWETHDRIHIVGANDLDVSIKPGTSAVLTTSALLVNSISAAIAAAPGFYPAVRLLPNPPWLAEHLR